MRKSDFLRLDFSLGDPLLPLTYAANYAFRKTGEDLHNYHLAGNLTADHRLQELHENISRYFTARGMHDADWSGLGTQGLVVTGGGTTEAYEYIIRALAEEIGRRQEETGQKLKPVIVMPVPTYGFFFNNARNWGIEIVKIERDLKNGGRLNPKDLADCFKSLNSQGKRVVAYYDSNPNNPTGLIRDQKETAQIARIVTAQNNYYSELDEKWFGSRKKGRRNWQGLTSRVKIIDDMVYDGLEYNNADKPYAFAQLRGEYGNIFRDTFTLFGTSKAGLANLRVGVLISHSENLKAIRRGQQDVRYSPPLTSYHASIAYFSDRGQFAGKRRKHLAALNEAHEVRGRLMKCLINGLEKTPEINAGDFENLVDLVSGQGIDAGTARRWLRSGIKGIEVITTPQSGFFHLMDFGGLKDIKYNDLQLKHATGYLNDSQYDEYMDDIGAFGGIERFRNHSISMLDDIEELAGANLAHGGWMGLETDELIARVTFAKPVSDIVELCGRLKKLSAFLHEPGPVAARELSALPAPAI